MTESKDNDPAPYQISVADLQQLYYTGLPMSHVGFIFEKHEKTIYSILKRNNTKIRSVGEAHRGERNTSWKGNSASVSAGRHRARLLFPCPTDNQRHHIDGNPLNNDPSNILLVTPKKHAKLDNRGKVLKNGQPRTWIRCRGRFCKRGEQN